jgi:hypothetical protein
MVKVFANSMRTPKLQHPHATSRSSARIHAAEICHLSNIIKDVVVLGIADPDIQKDVLAWEELDVKDDKEVVAFVESKELARNAWVSSQSSAAAASSNAAAISSYRRDRNQASGDDRSIDVKLASKGKCM